MPQKHIYTPEQENQINQCPMDSLIKAFGTGCTNLLINDGRIVGWVMEG